MNIIYTIGIGNNYVNYTIIAITCYDIVVFLCDALTYYFMAL